jgi:hypothetical protein
MPPLQALVALHGLWLLVFAALGIWIVRKWPPHRSTILGLVLFFGGLAGLASFIGYDLWKWWPTATAIQRKYVIQRALFVVGTTPDIPLIEATMTGMALWLTGRWRPSQVQGYSDTAQELVSS